MGLVSAPEKLTAFHNYSAFNSGEATIDDWLTKRALSNEARGASRTYVVCAEHRVVGFYALAVGAIEHGDTPGSIRRNMPNPVPVMLLGQLAVDRVFQGRGVGAGLLRDAVARTAAVAEIAGVRAILVHSVSDAAARFYRNFGFVASPIDPLMQMISISEALRIFDA